MEPRLGKDMEHRFFLESLLLQTCCSSQVGGTELQKNLFQIIQNCVLVVHSLKLVLVMKKEIHTCS